MGRKALGPGEGRGAEERELGQLYGCDERTIRNWRKEGAPLGDPVAMEEWLAARHTTPAGSQPEGLAAAKLEKLVWEAKRVRLKYEREKRLVVPIDEVTRDHTRIANAIRARFNQLYADAPTWAGLEAYEIEQRVKTFGQETCQQFHDESSKLYAVTMDDPMFA